MPDDDEGEGGYAYEDGEEAAGGEGEQGDEGETIIFVGFNEFCGTCTGLLLCRMSWQLVCRAELLGSWCPLLALLCEASSGVGTSYIPEQYIGMQLTSAANVGMQSTTRRAPQGKRGQKERGPSPKKRVGPPAHLPLSSCMRSCVLHGRERRGL